MPVKKAAFVPPPNGRAMDAEVRTSPARLPFAARDPRQERKNNPKKKRRDTMLGRAVAIFHGVLWFHGDRGERGRRGEVALHRIEGPRSCGALGRAALGRRTVV
jgi:hypothetical protein